MTYNPDMIDERIAELKEDYASDLVWGIRFDAPGLEIGHVFPISRIWDDGIPTNEFLCGTSVATDARLLGQYELLGTPYIVCGWFLEHGQDTGEVVVTDCEIIEII